jgi:trafficking protein particle complex subunit 3
VAAVAISVKPQKLYPRFHTLYLQLTQVAFKIYLNITPTVTSWTADDKSFSLIFDENPLADFVELPEDGPYEKIWYSNVLCGVIRGALEMVSPSGVRLTVGAIGCEDRVY